MKQTMKKSITLLLVLVQIFVLFPVLQPQAQAVQNDPETPILNKTIVGTVNFQSFNFLGDNETGEDGTDYSTTFYYTDDYFAHSAINTDVTKQVENWSALDDTSLASCSMAFTVAAMTSAEGDVISASSQTWNNSDYSEKDKNVISFLSSCGFTDIEPNGLTVKPGMDTIGYTIGSKKITVWNPDSERNETYTLVAVGIRGAGYGPEWANNVTIGTPGNGANVVRHEGFDGSAREVCTGVRNYLTAHNITKNVKYWVTGFSRAAAVANLTAGYISDDANSYRTSARAADGNRDVYGFTWECPQAASANENALAYKNIHNIVNAMDAVPKVSPTGFQHQRLGVDYLMPYYKNTSSGTQNTSYFNQMKAVLQTICRSDDPLLTAINNYPYNKAVPIYTVSARQLIDDGLSGNLATNFGTYKTVTGWLNRLSRGYVSSILGNDSWYMDQFIDNLINVFLTSTAWDRDYSGSTTNVITHRTRFIDNYQNDFRDLLGYMLDFSGPAFLGMVNKLIDAVGDQIGTVNWSNVSSNTGFALAFARFYFISTSYKDSLIRESQSLVTSIVNDMTTGYSHQTISRQRMNDALKHAVEVVIDLYADELDDYESQYFGTTLHWLWEILSMHEQETVLSWIMSLDPNHINRSCRTITIPAGCDATLYEFRPEYEGNLDDALNTTAPVVAEIKNGALVTETLKDQRIYCTTSGGNVVIRYPASLQIRADVTSSGAFTTGSVRLADYRTTSATVNVSNGKSQFETTALNSSTGYSSVTSTSATNVTATNNTLTNYGQLSAGDTLHILADDIADYNANNPSTYALAVDKAPTVTIAEYGKTDAGMSSGTDMSSAVQLGGTSSASSETTLRGIRTRQTTLTVPASSIYFDDELSGNSTAGYQSSTTRLDTDTESKTVWYKFRGTRIDAYCTTTSTTGYVQAAVTDENGNVVTVNGDRKIVTMKSASDTTRYNVPTISFDGLDANTDYYLKIIALKNANYQLDGIRVYHAADETDAAVQAAYEDAGEQNAKYVNLRGLLLGSVSEATVESTTAAGALFYTDSGTSYALTSSDYQTNSPKNEIYLAAGERVAFQIVGAYEKVAVGMSAPDSTTAGGSVTVTKGNSTERKTISNALDTYYEITPKADGSVMIENTGTAMISITNVKLSGDYTAPVSGQSLDVPLTVSKSLIRYAASFSTLADTTPAETAVLEETTAPTEEPAVTQTPEPTPSPTPTATPEPTPTPTNPSSDSSVMQLISGFVKSLFGGFSRLFRP